MSEALFIPGGEPGAFVATELARGPWDPGAQHGGAPAALLMRAVEALPAPPGLAIARVTYELLRPVPIGRLQVRAEVVRSGLRVQLLEATLLTSEGVEVVRARALALVAARAPASEPEELAAGPEGGAPSELRPPFQPMFAPDAMEVRFVEGQFLDRGPATAWFRLRVPVVEGEDPSPLQRLAAAADFGNGISSPLGWEEYLYINPDLTLYVERQPQGDWIGLDARTRIAAGGIGLSQSVLFDERGRVGHATQALLVAPREATSAETP